MAKDDARLDYEPLALDEQKESFRDDRVQLDLNERCLCAGILQSPLRARTSTAPYQPSADYAEAASGILARSSASLIVSLRPASVARATSSAESAARALRTPNTLILEAGALRRCGWSEPGG